MATRTAVWQIAADFSRARRESDRTARSLQKLNRERETFVEDSVEGNQDLVQSNKAADKSITQRIASLGRLQRAQRAQSDQTRATAKVEQQAAKATDAATEATERQETANKRSESVIRRLIERRRAHAAAQRAEAMASEAVVRAQERVSRATLSNEKAALALEAAERRLTNAQKQHGQSSKQYADILLSVNRRKNDAAIAANRLTQATNGLNAAQRQAAGGSSGLGGSLGRLGGSFFHGAAGARVLSVALAGIKFSAIILAVGGLVAALSNLAGGLVALVGPIASVGGALAALPGMFATAAGGVGTLLGALSGVGDALKAGLEAQKAMGQEATSLAKAEKTSARQIAQAQRGVKAARQSAADSARANAQAIEQATLSVRDAEEALADAHKAVADAREQARDQLEDYKESLEDLALQERGAALSVQEARRRLQETMLDPGADTLARQQAQLAYDEALDRLDDVRKEREKARKDNREAQRKGVEGSDVVQNALEQEQDAAENLKQAHQALADARRSAARSAATSAQAIADAEQAVADARESGVEATIAATAATNEYQEAMKNLSPEARTFVRTLLGMRDEMKRLRDAAAAGLLPGLGNALTTLLKLVPLAEDGLFRFGKVMGSTAEDGANLLTSGPFTRMFRRILDSNVRLMRLGGRALINIAAALVYVMDAARPFTEWLGETITGWTKFWRESAKAGNKSGELAESLDKTKRVLKILGRSLRNIWKWFRAVGDAGGDKLGVDLLRGFERITKGWLDFATSPKGRKEFQEWFEASGDALHEMSDLLGDVTRLFFDLGRQNELAPLIKQLRQELLPAIGRLLDAFQGDWAESMISALSSVVDLIAKLGEGSGGGLAAFWETIELVADTLNAFPEPVLEALVSALATVAALRFVGAVTGITSIAKALPGVIGGLGTFTTKMQDAERRAGFLGRAARTAAGVGGILALTASTGEATGAMKVLNRTVGGVLTGLAVGGPVGGAIGGVAGLASSFTDLEQAWADVFGVDGPRDLERRAREAIEKTNEAIARQKDLIDGLRTTIHQWTTTTETQGLAHENAIDQLTRAGYSTEEINASLKALGLTHRDLGRAAAGNKDAIEKVNAAYAKVNNAPYWKKRDERIIGEHEFADALDNSRVATREALKAERERYLVTQDLSDLYGKLPREVVTELESTGIKPTTRGIAQVQRKYDLLPRQVRSIIDLLGVDTSVKKVRRVAERLDTLEAKNWKPSIVVDPEPAKRNIKGVQDDLQRTNKFTADLSPWSRSLQGGLTKGAGAIKGQTGKIKDSLKDVGDTEVSGNWFKSLGDLFSTAEDKAERSGESVGRFTGRGFQSGLFQVSPKVSRAAERMVGKMIAAMEDEAEIRSPSKKTIAFGVALGDGLRVGLKRVERKVKRSGTSLITALLGGLRTQVISKHWENIERIFLAAVARLISKFEKAWERIKPIFAAVLDWAITKARNWWSNVTDVFNRGATNIQNVFERMVRGIENVWNRLRSVVSRPVEFVVNTVLNDGIIKTYNKLADLLPGINPISEVHFATGYARGGIPSARNMGVYPGYTPGRDVGYIGVSGGEAIMRPEWTRAVGSEFVDEMNRIARTGGVNAVRKQFRGNFASGGIPAVGTWTAHPHSQYPWTRWAGDINIAGSGDYGNPVRAYKDGVVASVIYLGDRSYGRYIKISHPASSETTLYAHLSAASVSPGQAVRRGQMIGRVGDLGRAFGPHLHFEISGGTSPIQTGGAIGGNIQSLNLPGWAKPIVNQTADWVKGRVGAGVKQLVGKFGDSPYVRMVAGLPKKLIGPLTQFISTATAAAQQAQISVAGTEGATVATGGSDAVRAEVQRIATAYGWGTGAQWAALTNIISRESGWNPNAANPTSSARGLFQKMTSIHGPIEPTVAGQTRWGLNYIRGRYGNPINAWNYWQAHGNYAQGGVVGVSDDVQAFSRGGPVRGRGNRDTVPAMLTPGEFVVRSDVVQRVGVDNLDRLNRSGRRRTAQGVQYFHTGGQVEPARPGPVLGMKKGAKGKWVKALEILAGIKADGVWDGRLHDILRRRGSSLVPRRKKVDFSGKRDREFLDWLTPPKKKKGEKSGKDYKPHTWEQALKRFKVNPVTLYAWMEGIMQSIRKVPKAGTTKILQGFTKFGRRYHKPEFEALNARLGIKKKDHVDRDTQRALNHVFAHTFGRAHDDFAYRPWKAWTPVEAAILSARKQNEKIRKWQAAMQTIAGWGFEALLNDLFEKGMDDPAGFNTAIDAAKNRRLAKKLNDTLAARGNLSDEDFQRLIRLVAFLNRMAQAPGLRDVARHLGLSDYETVRLYEAGQRAGRLKDVPATKRSTIEADIRSWRAGTFYFNQGGQVPGSGNRDSVPAMLTPGEFVVRREAAKALGLQNLWALNGLQKFAKGGLVMAPTVANAPTAALAGVSARRMSKAAAGTIINNVTYDVDIYNPIAERSTKSLTKALQRQSALKNTGSGTGWKSIAN